MPVCPRTTASRKLTGSPLIQPRLSSFRTGTDQLVDDNGKHPKPDPKNLDVRVRVGWVKGLARLYFLYEASDDYWDFARPREGRPDLVQSAVGHACEWETSMMLAIRPELVKPFAALPDMGVGYSFEPAYRGWITQIGRAHV